MCIRDRVSYENHPVKGELNIVKKGEVLDGFKDDFTYQSENPVSYTHLCDTMA